MDQSQQIDVIQLDAELEFLQQFMDRIGQPFRRVIHEQVAQPVREDGQIPGPLGVVRRDPDGAGRQPLDGVDDGPGQAPRPGDGRHR